MSKFKEAIDRLMRRTNTHKNVSDSAPAEKSLMKDIWIPVYDHSLPLFIDVIGYNKEWINEWNPNGTRIGYFTTEGNSDLEFHSAVYQSDSEDYGNCREEGDDYDTCQEQPDGTTKTWYNNDGNDVEGYRPNIPSHYMLIPKHPLD